MPLRIKLPSKERIIINGAVLENAGEATTIILHNHADILRRKEVMSEADAQSPARRVYYALQCAYMFEDERVRYRQMALELLNQYESAAPSGKSITEKIRAEIEKDRLYNALRNTHDLIEHEVERMRSLGLWPEEAASGSDDDQDEDESELS
ncbi:flagellum biosynthesis protein FlbT [Rhodospirillaceae bacterium KN72]|uniref:Flagellum biosynthesis protein FlbT n=1 Tax=Pacificispira spongiicola TaxID=2729598 RepID=A0A7Y0E361_9PROT|nr:flagellar biosynthesis repressor FlbT [Pacificispira spongiicola]NMM46348.1 flagellum biosynthesis protein FlbT [Pacificispira spongiicola]